jgi:hypothetical protein
MRACCASGSVRARILIRLQASFESRPSPPPRTSARLEDRRRDVNQRANVPLRQRSSCCAMHPIVFEARVLSACGPDSELFAGCYCDDRTNAGIDRSRGWRAVHHQMLFRSRNVRIGVSFTMSTGKRPPIATNGRPRQPRVTIGKPIRPARTCAD